VESKADKRTNTANQTTVRNLKEKTNKTQPHLQRITPPKEGRQNPNHQLPITHLQRTTRHININHQTLGTTPSLQNPRRTFFMVN